MSFTSLVRFIPRCIMLGNWGWACPWSVFQCDFYCCIKQASDLCKCILYVSTLLKVLIISRWFLMQFCGFFCILYHVQIRTVWHLFLKKILYSFSCIIAIASTSRSYWKGRGDTGHLNPDLESFLQLFVRVMFAVSLLCWDRFPSGLLSLGVLLLRHPSHSLKPFSFSIKAIHVIFPLKSIDLMITFIDLHKLSDFCNSQIKPTWSWWMIILICTWKYFIKTLGPVLIRYIGISCLVYFCFCFLKYCIWGHFLS